MSEITALAPPELQTYVFAKKPMLSYGFHNATEASDPTEVTPGSLLHVGINLIDLGIEKSEERHVLRPNFQFSLGFDEFDEPQPSWFPVVVESLAPDTETVQGTIIGEYHSFDREGYMRSFQGRRLVASLADLGMEPFEDGMWAADLVSIKGEGFAPLAAQGIELDDGQRTRIVNWLTGAQPTREYDRPLSIRYLQALIKRQNQPPMTIDQLRGMIDRHF